MNSEEIKKLAAIQSGICISVYIPTHLYGRETFEGEDMINFKSTIQRIENGLVEKGEKRDKVERLLRPAKELINDSGFWRHQSKGLAVFIADKFFSHYELPLEFSPFELVSTKFHLKPLLPLVFDDGIFYLLSFSKDQVKLYTGTKYSISEVDMEDLVPQGMEEALMYDDPSPGHLQFHSGSGAKSNAIFHGQGGGKDVMKTDIARYLNVVDEGVMKLIKGDKVPLVLAAVDYLIPIYKGVSKYNYITEGAVLGNQEFVNRNELHEKAWQQAESWISRNKRRAIENYRENPDASLVTSSPGRIIPAAYYKQVNQLFIEKGANLWGKFDDKNGKADIHPSYRQGDDCLINEAAIQTLVNGGEVYSLSKEEMPDKNSSIAAVLRFA